MIQSLVALSTIEAEYMAITEATKESLWLTGLVKELGIQQGEVQLYCDSQSAIYLVKNYVYHARTKHIDVRFHKIRELVSFGELLLEKVHTFDNAVDMLTKLITTEKFKHCLNLINVSRCKIGDAPTYCPRWSYKLLFFLSLKGGVNIRQCGDC